MERNLVLPVQPLCQEEDALLDDESQPYLEARLYIEKIEQENRRSQEVCKDIPCDPQPSEDPELLEQVPLAVYPVTVPSMHITCATVQWDMPLSNEEGPLSCTGSMDELNSDVGVSLDLTEELAGQTDSELQTEPTVTGENKENSCQDMDVNICVTPSNKEEQIPCKDISQTSEMSEDSGLKENTDIVEGSVLMECSDVNVGLESSEALEEYEETQDVVQDVLAQPDQTLEDAKRDAGNMDLLLLNGSESVSHSGMCQGPMTHGDQTPEVKESEVSTECDPGQESSQTQPSNISDPPEPAKESPEVAGDASQSVDVVQSERVEPEMLQSEAGNSVGNSEKSQPVVFVVTLDMISKEEALQTDSLEDEETSVKMRESDRTVEHGEPTGGTQVENSEEMELNQHTEQSEDSLKTEASEQTELSGCPPEQNDSEHLNKDNSEDEEAEEESNQSQSVTETKPSEESQQLECSGETEPAQGSEQESTEQTNRVDQPQQTEQPNHTNQTEQQNENKEQLERVKQTEQSLEELGNEEQPNKQLRLVKTVELPYKNGGLEAVDREKARSLAERLYKLENVQRTDVVQHMDKDNEFSHAVREEYLKFFDFTDQSLDKALRSFLKEVVLIGETQERERVLESFAGRFHQCNPQSFSSSGAVLTLTCAVMLLNTDLHGQNVGKAMSLTDFVSNLDGMNEGENFSKDLLKAFYNSIKNHQIEWAIEEKELAKSMILEQDSDQDATLRSKSNPFQNIAHDKKATVFQKGFLKRKSHADIDGKRTPWGKRSWKTFYAVLKGMVLYLQKDEYKKDWQSSEEVLSIHHALAERAQDYTKRPHVFRLQTADWRVFLFEAASTEQMNSWIGRINLVSALLSSPPFPAACGSQRKFCRPILPATQSSLTVEQQLQSHAAMLQTFQEDLSALQQGAAEGRKVKARDVEEHRHKEEYLQHERCRYEAYVQILEVWQTLGKSLNSAGGTDLVLFDQELWKGIAAEQEEDNEVDGGMKRSHSSPSLELEVAPTPVVKVRRNISERRTYRKIIVPRRNKEL